jgi:hypothetical protein
MYNNNETFMTIMKTQLQKNIVQELHHDARWFSFLPFLGG